MPELRSTNLGDVGGYSPESLKLSQVFTTLYGLSPIEAMDLAELMLKQSAALAAHSKPAPAPQVPVAPTPMAAAAPTPHHLEDANLSSWQQYSTLLESAPRDAASGQAAPRRSARPTLSKGK